MVKLWIFTIIVFYSCNTVKYFHTESSLSKEFINSKSFRSIKIADDTLESVILMLEQNDKVYHTSNIFNDVIIDYPNLATEDVCLLPANNKCRNLVFAKMFFVDQILINGQNDSLSCYSLLSIIDKENDKRIFGKCMSTNRQNRFNPDYRKERTIYLFRKELLKYLRKKNSWEEKKEEPFESKRFRWIIMYAK